MPFSPPRGIRPPQLEGKRTGRPRGTFKYTKAFRDAVWGYRNAKDWTKVPPNATAALWRSFAAHHYEEVGSWLRGLKVI